MKAYLITPDTQSLQEIDISSLDDIKSVIGFETIESDATGSEGDRLYFDEECFLRATPGRFQIDKLIPVAGKGVIAGTADDGVSLANVKMTLQELTQRIKYV